MNTLHENTKLIRSLLSQDMARLSETLGYHKPMRIGDSLRFGSKGSLAVNVSGPKVGQWYNHEDGIGGDPYSLIMHTLGVGFKDARQWAQQYLGGAVETLPKRPPSALRAAQRPDTGRKARELIVKVSPSAVKAGKAILRALMSAICSRAIGDTSGRDGIL